MTEKVKTGWEIPTEIKETFVTFCAHIGAIAQEDCAGALFLWQNMPSQIREWAKLEAKGSSTLPKEFWAGFSDGILASLHNLIENQSHKAKSPKKKGRVSVD